MVHPFYEKRVDAAGIPVLGSSKVPDEALEATREIVIRMLAHRADIRVAMISHGAQVAVIAESEVTTDIPEHAFLKDDANTDWNERARGLGGTIRVPTGSAAEENLLCYPQDRNLGESILVHEFAHSIKNLGMPFVEDARALHSRLDEAYASALSAGKWADTYAATNVDEYWAEGVQSWVDANLWSDPPNGIHNKVSTRGALIDYDPALADVIRDVIGEEWRYSCPTDN